MVRAHLYIVVAWSDVLRRYTVKVFPALLANDITPKVFNSHTKILHLFCFFHFICISQQVAVSWQVLFHVLNKVDQGTLSRLARRCEQLLNFIRLLSGWFRSFVIAKIDQAVLLLRLLNHLVYRFSDRLW